MSVGEGDERAYHIEHMKAYVDDDFMGTAVPLYHLQNTSRASLLDEATDPIDRIKRHRMFGDQLKFLVYWKASGETSWDKPTTFFQNISHKLLEYIKAKAPNLPVLQHVLKPTE